MKALGNMDTKAMITLVVLVVIGTLITSMFVAPMITKHQEPKAA